MGALEGAEGGITQTPMFLMHHIPSLGKTPPLLITFPLMSTFPVRIPSPHTHAAGELCTILLSCGFAKASLGVLGALLVGMLDGRAPAEHHITIPTIYGDLNSQSI